MSISDQSQEIIDTTVETVQGVVDKLQSNLLDTLTSDDVKFKDEGITDISEQLNRLDTLTDEIIDEVNLNWLYQEEEIDIEIDVIEE